MELDDSSSLSQTANVIASGCFLSTFKACFVPFCQIDVSDNNLRLVTGKTAGFLHSVFQGIKQVTLEGLRRFVFVANNVRIISFDDHK